MNTSQWQDTISFDPLETRYRNYDSSRVDPSKRRQFANEAFPLSPEPASLKLGGSGTREK